MERSFFIRISRTAALVALTCAWVAGAAVAQEGDSSSPAAQTEPKGRFVTLPAHYSKNAAGPLTPTVTNWTGSLGSGLSSFTMVGTDPSSTNTTTTVTAYLVPIRLLMSPTPGGIFDPAHVLPNGRSVTQNVVDSPIFNAGIDFVQGGTDLGNTQYLDAFQRATFWSYVKTNTDYHVLLNVVVLPTVTISVPAASGSIGTEFGVRVALMDINFFDAKWQSIISANGTITPNSFPIALTYDTYLTSGGCCIGGYHSAYGNASAPQTYAQFSYIDHTGVFSQDVSALSHETGEWMDDPFTNNAGCGGLLEVGDPLEGETNYGGYPYTLNGFTYNLQDLVLLQYFGQSPSTSVNGWYSFQNANLTVCSNGQ